MNDEILHIPLTQIEVVSNTRSDFNENGLKELAQSIKSNGVIQAIVVRREASGKYRLICGERRFRASLLAGQADIPARVMEVTDAEILTMQVVENLQRRNVSTMDEIRAIVRLRDENSMSVVEIGKAIGKHISHVEAQFKISRSVPELHAAIEKNYLTRTVALLIAGLDTEDKQIQAVSALKRENPAYIVKRGDAEKWIDKTFGAQAKKRPYGHNGQTKQSAGRFASDWKYYFVRFSAEQFERWKEFVSNRTDTEVFASAVEAVMSEETSASADSKK